MSKHGPTLCFNSKMPHDRPWLSVSYPVGERPDTLLDVLAQIGWAEDTKFRRFPPLEGRQEITVIAPSGSGFFGSWNDQEKAREMRRVRRVLRVHGYANVPWNKLTITDLM